GPADLRAPGRDAGRRHAGARVRGGDGVMWFALTKWVRFRHLPWVAAGEARDCGAAAFASVARHHGHHLTLEEARQRVGTDRNGTTLAGLRDGGRSIGLESRPAHGTYEALGQLSLPAIV